MKQHESYEHLARLTESLRMRNTPKVSYKIIPKEEKLKKLNSVDHIAKKATELSLTKKASQ